MMCTNGPIFTTPMSQVLNADVRAATSTLISEVMATEASLAMLTSLMGRSAKSGSWTNMQDSDAAEGGDDDDNSSISLAGFIGRGCHLPVKRGVISCCKGFTLVILI